MLLNICRIYVYSYVMLIHILHMCSIHIHMYTGICYVWYIYIHTWCSLTVQFYDMMIICIYFLTRMIHGSQSVSLIIQDGSIGKRTSHVMLWWCCHLLSHPLRSEPPYVKKTQTHHIKCTHPDQGGKNPGYLVYVDVAEWPTLCTIWIQGSLWTNQ